MLIFVQKQCMERVFCLSQDNGAVMCTVNCTNADKAAAVGIRHVSKSGFNKEPEYLPS
jgi:hypothetical protein